MNLSIEIKISWHKSVLSKSVDLNQFCNGTFDSVKVEIRQLSGTMSSEIQSIKQDVSDIHGRIDKMAYDFNDLKQEVNHLKVKVERKSSGSSGHSSGSDKEKQCSRKLKLEGFGSDKPLSLKSIKMSRNKPPLTALRIRMNKHIDWNKRDWTLNVSICPSLYRSELAQSELSSRSLNAEYKNTRVKVKGLCFLCMRGQIHWFAKSIRKHLQWNKNWGWLILLNLKLMSQNGQDWTWVYVKHQILLNLGWIPLFHKFFQGTTIHSPPPFPKTLYLLMSHHSPSNFKHLVYH